MFYGVCHKVEQEKQHEMKQQLQLLKKSLTVQQPPHHETENGLW